MNEVLRKRLCEKNTRSQMGENFGTLLEKRKRMVKNRDANSTYGRIDKKNNVSSNTRF